MSRLPSVGSDDGNWGSILNDFLRQAHTDSGNLKADKVAAAGAEMLSNKFQAGGYPGLDSSSKLTLATTRSGVSQQTAFVLEDCEVIVTGDDLNAGSYYTYDNGASGVGATISSGSHYHLGSGATPLQAGWRVVVNGDSYYGSTAHTGIYVVTNPGSDSSGYVLTRASDSNSADTLGVFTAARLKHDDSTVYFSPNEQPFVVGTTSVTLAIEATSAHAENGGKASAIFAHAEGQATALGNHAHAEGSGYAQGNTSHAEGNGNAYDDLTHAEGSAAAHGYASHAENGANTTGEFSHAENFGAADGRVSHAEGSARAYTDGLHSEGFAPYGGGQRSSIVLGAITFNNSPFTLQNYYGAPGHIFPDSFNYVGLLRIRVLARRNNPPADISVWTAQCILAGNRVDSYRLVGSPAFTLVNQDAGASSWSVSDLAINGSNPRQLDIKVVGENSTALVWSATIDFDEIL